MANEHPKRAANAPNRATAAPRPTTTADESPAAPHTLPERFGRYRILKTLGKGGMGTVYLAHDTQLDRPVALKVPHFAAADAWAMARFQREARIAAGIHHPNLCPVHDVGDVNGIPYLTMAYIEGRPLSTFLRGDKPLPQRQVALLVRKLAAALQEAHRQGIVHRDLKPANIMINQRQEPVIMDFGLAQRSQTDDVRLTRNGALVGTPAYMPPEQASGDLKAIGPACDVYSLGVILYELLTGRLPFDGPLAAVLAQVLFQEPEPPRQHRLDLDPALEAICLKAMAKKIADRYPSMAELHDALGVYLRSAGTPDAGRTAAVGLGPGREPPSPAPAEPLFEVPDPPLLTVPPSAPAAISLRGAEPAAQPGKTWPRKWLWLACSCAAALLLVGIVLYTSAGSKATLEIKLDDPGAVVSLDGTPLSSETVAQPIPLSAGEHTVVVARDEVVKTQQFTLQNGEKRVLVFELGKPSPPPPPPPSGTIRAPDLAPQPGQPPPPPPGAIPGLPVRQPGPPPTRTEIGKLPPGEEHKRGRPNVLVPEEVRLAFVRGQIPRLHFECDKEGRIAKVWAFKDGSAIGAEQPPGKPFRMRPDAGTLEQFASGMKPLVPRPGNRGRRELASAFRTINPPDGSNQLELIPLARAEQRVLATDALALRMVIVEASFPYKEQVEEFRRKLRLPNHGAVLTELVKGKDGKIWSSFQFNGLIVERTTVGADGKEGPWTPLDVETPFKELIVQLPPQKRYEKEKPNLAPILTVSEGLVMPRPAQYEGKNYPKLEEELTKIQATLAKLTATDKKGIITPDVLRTDFNPYNLGAGRQNIGPVPPEGLSPRKGNRYGVIPGTSDLKETPFDYCLIRFIDVAIDPGKTYKYRFKVKMANPNCAPEPAKRTDTLPQFAASEELVAAEWAASPTVTVPGDEFLFAVDQSELRPKYPDKRSPDSTQAVFQIHRWVDVDAGWSHQNVGDWLVAPRIFVERGEFVQTPPNYALEVPVYLLGKGHLSLIGSRKRRGTILAPVSFGDDSLLVDFEGGRILYTRTETEGGKIRLTHIVDRVATEVLIMRADGKMIARNSADDAKDPLRQQRYQDYVHRVKEARDGPKKSWPGGRSPFDR